MIFSNRRRFLPFLYITILLLSTITGCRPGEGTDNPSTSTPEPPPISTLEPTAIPQKIILVDSIGTASEELKSYLNDFAVSSGLVLETSTQASPPPEDETRVVIYLTEPADLQNLAAAAPQTQFIVAGSADPNGLNNISAIKYRPQDLAFMAGYLTTLIAEDWRSAGIIPNDTVLGEGYADAFENGGRFVCGLCVPYYAPFKYFPLIKEAPSATDAVGWVGLLPELDENYVNTVFLDPSAAKPEVIDELVTRVDSLIGIRGTSSAPSFTALLDYDLITGLDELLPQALDGGGGKVVIAQVKIVSITDENIITPAKVEKFNQTAADLVTGWISPFRVP